MFHLVYQHGAYYSDVNPLINRSKEKMKHANGQPHYFLTGWLPPLSCCKCVVKYTTPKLNWLFVKSALSVFGRTG